MAYISTFLNSELCLKSQKQLRVFMNDPVVARRSWIFICSLWIFFAVVVCQNSSNQFWFDSQAYWSGGTAMFSGDSFSFLKYDLPIRGYFFSFLLGIVGKIAQLSHINEVLLVRLLNSAMAVAEIVWLIPALLERFFKYRITNFAILIFSLFILIFWRGLFVCPLADFPAVFSLSLVFLSITKDKTPWWFLAGLALAFTLLTRPVYLISLPFVFALMLVRLQLASNQVWKIAAFLIAVVLSYAPQVYINKNLYDTYSPMPQTERYFKGSFYWANVQFGVYVQKYETYTGTVYPNASVMSNNQFGQKILDEQNGVPIRTLSDWLMTFVNHPVLYPLVMLSHIGNAFDLMYPNVYIDTMKRSVLFSWANYTLWFIFFGLLIRVFKVKFIFSRENLLFLGALIFPMLATIPNHVESRFYLIMFILCYLLIATNPGRIKEVFTKKTIPFYFLFLIVCFYLSIQVSLGIKDLKLEWAL